MNAVRKAAIVSLSSGVLGEDFVRHEVEIGLRRLADYGIETIMMPNAQKGIAYLKEHPEKRAEDLLRALSDDSIDMILCAIGGDDTYRLLPHLFEHNELQETVRKNTLWEKFKQKIFLGFSDTTMNHLMLHKVGIKTFYGQSFLSDLCELDTELLPYTAHYFEELIRTGTISEIRPSNVWYEERTDFSTNSIGIPRTAHTNTGFELLQGSAVFRGKILGGCLDTLYDVFDNTRYKDSAVLCARYDLFPALEDWKGHILLLETSEEQPTPEHYRRMLLTLKATGIFDVISGILCGKPMDERFHEEYKKIIVETVGKPELPIVANVNIGHATPRCIIPFEVDAVVDTEGQVIRFAN